MIFILEPFSFTSQPLKQTVPGTLSTYQPLNRGFTLIEIAIVLVIIGLLLGLGAGLVGPLTKRIKYNETKDRIDAAVESVVSFAAANNRIPTTSEFPSEVRNPRDAWTKDLYYIPDADIDDLNAGGVCGRKTTGITVRDCTNAACTSYNDISNVAFVVISGSENHNIQTDNVGGTVTVYEVDTASIDDYTTDMNRPEAYDDIVNWVTLNELRIKSGCVGAPLKIVNNELPYGYQNSAYSNVTVYADGGVPFSSGGEYRWCRQESSSTGLTFSPSTLNADCSSLAEASWGQADNLAISGTPTVSGSFNLTFFVRDNNDSSGTNDNITQKTFVLTINPDADACTNYTVWNDAGGRKDYLIDGTCKAINNNSEITTPELLDSGETIERYNTNNGSCGGGVQATLTFIQAQSADSDGDCQVNFTGTDR